MPIKIPDELPAKAILEKENIFVMGENRAFHQDIRPLGILILNLMPVKETTETQLLRLLGNSPLQVEVTLLRIASHESRNTSQEHLTAFYKTFDEVKYKNWDGLIITGAPIEHLDYSQVRYWPELADIMEWSKDHVTSTMHICWGAQAGLYYHFGIPKYPLDSKMFGVYKHRVLADIPLVRGFDEEFLAPHSRHTEVRQQDISGIDDLVLVSDSEDAGVYIAASRDGRQIFVTGHSEYDVSTLAAEYERDKSRGLEIQLPVNYFPADNPENLPVHRWKSHAYLLFSNWLNYYVYQETPFDLASLASPAIHS